MPVFSSKMTLLGKAGPYTKLGMASTIIWQRHHSSYGYLWGRGNVLYVVDRDYSPRCHLPRHEEQEQRERSAQASSPARTGSPYRGSPGHAARDEHQQCGSLRDG